MKKLLLIISLTAITVMAKGQYKNHKWVKSGWILSSEGITHTYTLTNKDSISFHVLSENCTCDFYIEIGNHVKHSCKDLQRHYLETVYWTFEKNIIINKQDTVKITKPHWSAYLSGASLIGGTYTVNGKEVYPTALYKNNKLQFKINDY